VLVDLEQASAFISVIIIDIVLAGDNAIVVAMAAAGLPVEHRRRVIAAGIGAATVLRILFAFVAVELLQTVIGVTLGGGLLLLWVAWKMHREISDAHSAAAPGEEAGAGRQPRKKTPMQALGQIVLADLSMSLDNVLAVAGVARDHPFVLVVGLVLSIALMGVASTFVARLLDRASWLSWVGLGIITLVALRMIWDGSTQILHQSAALSLALS